MITINVNENEKKVYVDVSGYINKRDANNFLNTYKQTMKNKKASLYKLVVNPEYFECEDNEDIKRVCMTFYKTGYKKIFIVDEDNYIMSNLNLKPLERKLFLKSVKIVKTMEATK